MMAAYGTAGWMSVDRDRPEAIGTTSFQAKATTDPRIGAMEHCSDRVS
jgi:hypothetical protein